MDLIKKDFLYTVKSLNIYILNSEEQDCVIKPIYFKQMLTITCKNIIPPGKKYLKLTCKSI